MTVSKVSHTPSLAVFADEVGTRVGCVRPTGREDIAARHATMQMVIALVQEKARMLFERNPRQYCHLLMQEKGPCMLPPKECIRHEGCGTDACVYAEATQKGSETSKETAKSKAHSSGNRS